MAYNRNQARALSTAAEYELFEASLGDRIKEHTPARLKGKIKRARNLRDKYRDLFKRQQLANRARTGTKKGARPDTNARTEQKARLFDEVLGRFERRAEQLAADDARSRAPASAQGSAGGKAARGEPPKARKTRQSPAVSGFVNEAAAGVDRRRRLQKTRSKAVQGHVRAAGRRRQARRDSRR